MHSSIIRYTVVHSLHSNPLHTTDTANRPQICQKGTLLMHPTTAVILTVKVKDHGVTQWTLTHDGNTVM